MAQEECSYRYEASPECVLDGLETFLTQGAWRVISEEDGSIPFSRCVVFEEAVPDAGREPTRFDVNCLPVTDQDWVGVIVSASMAGWGLFQKGKQKEALTQKVEAVHAGLNRAVIGCTQAGHPPRQLWPRDPAAAQFDTDWKYGMERFGVVVGIYRIKFDLKHPETGRSMAPHAGLGGTFSDWQKVEAPYDKLCVIMDQIYTMMRSSLSRAQTAHYLVATRRSLDALALLEAASGLETSWRWSARRTRCSGRIRPSRRPRTIDARRPCSLMRCT
jgi:hypothetical protein